MADETKVKERKGKNRQESPQGESQPAPGKKSTPAKAGLTPRDKSKGGEAIGEEARVREKPADRSPRKAQQRRGALKTATPSASGGKGGQTRPTMPKVGGTKRAPGRTGQAKQPAAVPRSRPAARLQGGEAVPAGAAEVPTAARTPEKMAESPPPSKIIEIPAVLTVRELANLMQVSPIDVIKELMDNGIMANINQQIDFDTAAIVGQEMGFEVKQPSALEPEVPEETIPLSLRRRLAQDENPDELQPRPPVVTVLGHVDHGKTTLLDAIRHTNVVAGEAGGITQHVGAYQVELGGRKITFLDTPGHEAFTAMRARGAEVTDVAVLVVAADDGVMPQTREAVDHARAARVPIVVALNKTDKPNANPERVKQQLADIGLTVEDWGGDVICVPISAKQKAGIEELLENILLVTEVAELKANPNRLAQGTVIESKLDERRGPTATLLVQNGTLRVGDILVIGETHGRVRAMFDDKGQVVNEAGPSTPVVVLGLPEVPRAGDILEVVGSERIARGLTSQRAEERRDKGAAPVARPLSLEEAYEQILARHSKELNLILKADVQGSIEPIVSSLEKLDSEELKIKLLHQGTGNITESDIMLAVASNAIVIGFNVQMDPAAQRMAEATGVDVRLYEVIYRLIDDMDLALKGLLEPAYKDVVIGHAEVRAIFRLAKRGNVAGIYVLDGQVTRDALARIRRNDNEIYDGRVASLKRFADDVKEVTAGFECGVGLEGFDSFEQGDIIEFYYKERVR